jgi:hypothetical protein
MGLLSYRHILLNGSSRFNNIVWKQRSANEKALPLMKL